MSAEEKDWISLDSPPDTLVDLLSEVGRVHAPFLLANSQAIAKGAERVECEIDGKPWVQEPFVYQSKCLKWLRERFAALSGEAKQQVAGVLSGTGCDELF